MTQTEVNGCSWIAVKIKLHNVDSLQLWLQTGEGGIGVFCPWNYMIPITLKHVYSLRAIHIACHLCHLLLSVLFQGSLIPSATIFSVIICSLLLASNKKSFAHYGAWLPIPMNFVIPFQSTCRVLISLLPKVVFSLWADALLFYEYTLGLFARFHVAPGAIVDTNN